MNPYSTFGFLLLAGTACAGSLPRQITLERTACYGTCPVYAVTIDSSGTVTYDGRANVYVTGTKTGKIAPADFDRVWAKVESIDFWHLPDRYDHVLVTRPDGTSHPTTVTDLPQNWVTVTDGSRSKRVLDYFGAPTPLKELEVLIDSVARTRHWIDRPKPAPERGLTRNAAGSFWPLLVCRRVSRA